MQNTRFNPTVNGLLHVGHLLQVLVNEHEAHASGGKFCVRFDDNQIYWNKRLGRVQVDHLRQMMIDDISLFAQVDEWSSQIYDYTYVIDTLQTTTPELAKLKIPEVMYYHLPEFPADPGETWFPYAPLFTAEKVWIDHDEKISWLIRGVDLISEFGIYEYFRELFEYPEMRHTYLPRVMIFDGKRFSHLAKSLGDQYSLRNLLQRLDPRDIVNKLRKGCLKNPESPFSADNVALQPRFFHEG